MPGPLARRPQRGRCGLPPARFPDHAWSPTPSASSPAAPLPRPYEDLLERAITVWIALVGTISFELYGHLHNGITDYDAYFDAAMTVAADGAGLDLKIP